MKKLFYIRSLKIIKYIFQRIHGEHSECIVFIVKQISLDEVWKRRPSPRQLGSRS